MSLKSFLILLYFSLRLLFKSFWLFCISLSRFLLCRCCYCLCGCFESLHGHSFVHCVVPMCVVVVGVLPLCVDLCVLCDFLWVVSNLMSVYFFSCDDFALL